MIKYTEHCDLCEKEFDEEKENNDKNGFCIEIGYSLKGWGRRKDFIPNTRIEVCNTCFKVLKKEALKFKKTIQKLKTNQPLN